MALGCASDGAMRRRRPFGRIPVRGAGDALRRVAGCDLADREGAWSGALLAGDVGAMADLACEPLPVDAPMEARERWAGRRDVLAEAGVEGCAVS